MSGQDKFKDRGPEDGFRRSKITGIRNAVKGYDAALVIQPCLKASVGFVLHAGLLPPLKG